MTVKMAPLNTSAVTKVAVEADLAGLELGLESNVNRKVERK
jgi:hypothetical protein